MEIELFQLENLMHSRTRYALFDLREEALALPAELTRVLAGAERIAKSDVGKHLEKAGKSAPAVLFCEDGRVSARLAGDLEAAGFANVYVVAGGVAGLLSELDRAGSSSTK